MEKEHPKDPHPKERCCNNCCSKKREVIPGKNLCPVCQKLYNDAVESFRTS
ncbi:MAG TPA: hypothetical protein PLK35_03485 [Candidatus Moranbacteria bacterium]|nr:hypothetical protein [Candidatus Moranbacteria bacterium]